MFSFYMKRVRKEDLTLFWCHWADVWSGSFLKVIVGLPQQGAWHDDRNKNRKTSQIERFQLKRRMGKRWWPSASAPDCMVYCIGKPVGSARPPITRSPPQPQFQPHAASAPATLCCVSQESQTLQLALLNQEKQRDRKKKKQKEREVTQLEDISWSRARSLRFFHSYPVLWWSFSQTLLRCSEFRLTVKSYCLIRQPSECCKTKRRMLGN